MKPTGNLIDVPLPDVLTSTQPGSRLEGGDGSTEVPIAGLYECLQDSILTLQSFLSTDVLESLN